MNSSDFQGRRSSKAVAWHDAGALDALGEGLHLRLIGTQQVLVVRRGDEVFATEPLCPHKFALLSDGELLDGCIKCPQHEAHFDPATGQPGEGEEWAGQLPTWPCRVEDGRIQVQID